MSYFTLALDIIVLALFLFLLVLILLNKFDNKFVQCTLNDNIINLLYGEKYTKSTLKKIKFMLIFRVLYFTLGFILIGYGNFNSSLKCLIPLILIILRTVGNNFIEKWLEKDYMDFNAEV